MWSLSPGPFSPFICPLLDALLLPLICPSPLFVTLLL